MTTAASFQEKNLQALVEKVAQDEGFKNPKFEVTLGSKPGDNFVGRIFRAVVTEKDQAENEKRLSLIFKASPLSQVRKKMLSTDEMFQIESEVYQVVLPTFNKLLNDLGVADSNVFPGTARCFATEVNGPDSEECHALVLEDKAVTGFQMFSGKNKVLDAEHCRAVLKKIALWHATSMALYHHNPEAAEKLAEMLYKETMPVNDENCPIFDETVPGSLEALRKANECCNIDSTAYKKCSELFDNYRKELVRVNQRCPDLFCIVQGDCWTNNVLFKYSEDGRVEDVCLVDLQIGRVASPVLDVIYFFCMCTTKEVRDAHYEELIRFYYDEVCSNLKKLKCNPEDIITWELLQEHIKKYGRQGVFISVFAIPVLAAESSEIHLDLHDSNHEGNVFIGGANIKDEKKQKEIWRRVADIVEDANRLGFI